MNTVLGIDHHSSAFYNARVENDAGRPRVVRLWKSATSTIDSSIDGRTVLAVPDRDVTVKPLYVPGSDEATVRARLSFELARSVLEDEEQFAFDYHPLAQPESYLGFVFRRERLAQLAETCGLTSSEAVINGTFRARSMALGRGYLAFCEPPEGELICVAELIDRAVSICFIYQRRVVDLAFLSLDNTPLASPAGRERFAVDLKTIVNFRLAALHERRIGLPLAVLIVFGASVDEDLHRGMQRYFPIGVDSPRLREGFFGDLSSEETGPFERYLVALGLAVNRVPF